MTKDETKFPWKGRESKATHYRDGFTCSDMMPEQAATEIAAYLHDLILWGGPSSITLSITCFRFARASVMEMASVMLGMRGNVYVIAYKCKCWRVFAAQAGCGKWVLK